MMFNPEQYDIRTKTGIYFTKDGNYDIRTKFKYSKKADITESDLITVESIIISEVLFTIAKEKSSSATR